MRVGGRKGETWATARKGTQENRWWAYKLFHHHHFALFQPFQITTSAPQVCNGHIIDLWFELCPTEVWPSPWWIYELAFFCIMIREKKKKMKSFHHQPSCSCQDLESLLTLLVTCSSQPIIFQGSDLPLKMPLRSPCWDALQGPHPPYYNSRLTSFLMSTLASTQAILLSVLEPETHFKNTKFTLSFPCLKPFNGSLLFGG